ncbi:3'(2'),5'-bisphosphate nucleotidase CysQ [Neptunomonas antarctica]|uniref:3'(2'),5'-bisphosphate nucleotidase CysQ n=1 Tax=Neptunomonas antarctica TaxID=619304 RepID=A0A1N7KI71_9GAMM|nr:3'(2'),5'-bisphosphate nucleotidase CysQ [Neptunomonas antarctica]SIS61257.1 3'(2'),5'-bisphosphate nucleotidase [Neptunomonas antarctica]
MQIDNVIVLVRQAAIAVMDIYRKDFSVFEKSDNSPLTAADMAAHHILVDGLTALTPDIPVLSEESDDSVKIDRINWSTYWLIDPLDGTKEFIKKNGEFTINVALIKNGVPVLGVVLAPADSTLYWGELGKGAFKQIGLEPIESISVSAVPDQPTGWRVLGSRSHQSPAFKVFMESLPEAHIIGMGSSLKLCLVAEGAADLYPRLSPTSEWDTAAGHAVVLASGGQVLALDSLAPLVYNANSESLLNPSFVVCAEPSVFWAQ